MALRITLLFLVVSLGASCQKQEYSNIKGTHLSLVVPEGFSQSPGLTGVEFKDEAMVYVMDLVGGNLESNTRDFRKSYFEAKGIEILEMDTLRIDGFPAKFAHLKKDGSETMMLVLGDDTFSVMLSAMIVKNHAKFRPIVKEMLMSARYDKNLKVDPFASAAFSVSKNDSRFKFAKTSANIFLFSEGGVVKDGYKDEPMVMIIPFPKDNTMTKQDLLDSMLGGLLQQGFVKKEVRNISVKPINGYDSMQAEVYLYKGLKEQMVWLCVLVKGDVAIGFYGTSHAYNLADLAEFKKLVTAIQIK